MDSHAYHDRRAGQVDVVGQLYPIGRDGMATGWCWSPQEPDLRRTVVLVRRGMELATAQCDRWQEGLAALGIGDGGHAFAVSLPGTALAGEDPPCMIELRDLRTGQCIGEAAVSPEPSQGAPAAPASAGPMPVSAPAALLGLIDRVSAEGLVVGWCYDPARPRDRLQLQVMVEGTPAGEMLADLFRADLRDSAIGDGAHGFEFLLPWSLIAARSSARITVLETASGRSLPSSATFRRPDLVCVEERLRDADRQMRLLSARLDEAERRAAHERAANRAVLRSMGAFFSRLADAELDLAADPHSLGALPLLAELIDSARAELPPFALAQPQQPELTICLTADGTAGNVHASLRALMLNGLDRHAEIVLLDPGFCDRTALLPSLVQNLRYWRLQPMQSLTEARNRILSSARTPFVALLSADARPTGHWLGALMDTFARLPNCAVLGGKSVGTDGRIVAAGLLPGPNGRLQDFARAEHAHTPACDHLRAVVAVADRALVARSSVFLALGGLDQSFDDDLATVVDFCIRCWEHGSTVQYQPLATLAWSDASVLGVQALPPVLDDLLAHRWRAAQLPNWPTSGRRLLLLASPGDAKPGTPGLLPTALALQHLGYEVSVALPGHLEAGGADLQVLRGIGVHVLRAPFQTSILAAMPDAPEPYALILLTCRACRAVPLAELRLRCGGAKLVVCLDDTALPELADLAPPAPGPLAQALGDADLVIARTEPECELARAWVGDRAALLRDERPDPFLARRAIGLIARASDAALQPEVDATAAWLIARLRRRLPDVAVIPLGNPATGLEHLRIAVALAGAADTDPPSLAACSLAGAVLVALDPRRDEAEPDRFGPATRRELLRVVLKTYSDRESWRRAAGMVAGSTPAALAAAYATALKGLGLNTAPDGHG